MKSRPTANEIEHYLKSFPNVMYKHENDIKNSEKNINRFIEDFPIDRIENLTIKEYSYSPNGYGDSDSFCNRLFRIDNSSMNGSRGNFCGVYFKLGDGYTATGQTLKKHGSLKAAFEWQISEIVNLIKAGEQHDLNKIVSNNVNKYIKAKILSVYFPNEYLPMNAKGYVNNFLNALNIEYKDTEDIIVKTEKLRAWKNSHPQSKKWSNMMFMRFCDEYFKYSKEEEKCYPNPSIDAIKYDVWKIAAEERTLKERLRKEAEEAEKNQYNLPDFTNPISDTEREAIVKERIGQGRFRDELLKSYGYRCMVCGLNIKPLLRASHIKAWKDSDNQERLDVNNGLLLCTTHDSLFDSHLISFDCNRKMLINNKITSVNRKLLNISETTRIDYSEKTEDYMKYHRNIYDSLNH